MLEINKRTKPIFLAARLESDLMPICREISVTPQIKRRMALLEEAKAVIAKMHENAVQNFGGRPLILDNLKGLEDEIEALARRPGEFAGEDLCPTCGGPIRLRKNLTKTCDWCMEPILQYRDRLASEDGFGTCNI
jgi:hypothetical protein